MEKIIKLLLLVSFIFVTSCSASNDEKYPNNGDEPEDIEEDIPADISLSDKSGKQLPILAWEGIKGIANAKMYKDLADAGFTINLAPDLCWAQPSDLSPTILFKALDDAAAIKMKHIVSALWLRHLSKSDIIRLKNHSGLAGYFLKDEPTTYGEITTLKEWVEEVQAIDKEHFCYINLAGCDCRGADWAPELIGCTDIEPSPCANFVKTFAEEVNLPMISVDRYTVNINASTNQRELMPGWYYTLELMSKNAKDTGKEFWAFALATEHKVSTIYYPIPTMNDLRLQMYSNLGYGAQCLQYFTYGHSFVSGYGQAPITSDGTKTSTYYTIQEMNKELIALSPVFLNSKMKWVAHTGVIPDGCTELDKDKLPSVFKTLDITGGSGALVSLLEKGEDNFLLVVNHDIKGTVSVKATGTSDLHRVNKEGNPVLLGKTAQQLEPGDAVIYFWKKK